MGLKWCGGTAVLALALLLAVALAPRAFAADPLSGVALVIGNGDYAHLPALANPGDDADAVEELLSDLGFDSVRRTDRDAEDLARDLDRFVEDAAEADVAVLYYAGHGIEAGGENFLVPVDADLSALDAASERLVPLSAVLARLRESVPVTILLLDACRDNPFPPGATLKLAAGAEPLPISAGGLAETRGARALSAPAADGAESLGVVIGFAAEPGKPALDGQPGEHSPYAAALTRHLAAMAGDEFGTVMRMVAEEVYLKTSGRQRPWVNESLRRLLFFGEAPAPLAGPEGEILSERRQLLVTIAALPDFERRQVERVAADGGVPMDALYGMLRVLGEDVPDDPEDLDRLLRRQAEELARLIERRDVLAGSDEELARLARLTDRAVAEGAMASALRLRREVDRRIAQLEKVVDDEEARIRARRLEFAAEFARSAEVAALAGDFAAAAGYYAHAFERAERWDDRLAFDYRNGEGLMRLQQARFFPNRTAIAQAVSTLRDAADLARHDADNLLLANTNLAAALALVGKVRGDLESLAEAEALSEATLAAIPESDVGRRTAALANRADILAERGALLRNPDILRAAIDAYRRTGSLWTPGEHPREWATIQGRIAGLHLLLAQTVADGIHLRQGLEAVDAALGMISLENAPSLWLTTFYTKGNLLVQMAQSTNSAANARRAIAIFDELGAANPPQAGQLNWASILTSRGAAQAVLGAIEADAGVVAQAIATFREVIARVDRDDLPEFWAEAQFNLGSALEQRIRMRVGPMGTDEAANAFAAAAEAYPQATRFNRWVDANARLAEALLAHGSLGGKAAAVERAITVYEHLVEVGDPRLTPPRRALLLSRLGAARMMMQYQDGAVAHLRAAIAEFRRGAALVDPETFPQEWLSNQANLGSALVQLAEATGSEPDLVEAVAVFEEVVGQSDASQGTREWALVRTNAARAFIVLGKARNNLARVDEAVQLLDIGLEILDHSRWPHEWHGAMQLRSHALQHLGVARGDPEMLTRAADDYRAMLARLERDWNPLQWADMKRQMAVALAYAGRLAGDSAAIEEGVSAFADALAVFTREAHPDLWVETMNGRGIALIDLGLAIGDRDVILAARQDFEALRAFTKARGDRRFDDALDQRIAFAERALAELEAAE